MKIIILKVKVVIVCVLLFLSCNSNSEELEKSIVVDKNEFPVNTSQKTVFDDSQIDSCANLMLEVKTSRFGATSPKGEVLDIRILRDRKTEYDEYAAGIENTSVERKELILSELQMKNLLMILHSDTLINSKSEYAGDYYCCDVFIKKTLIFCIGNKKKEISISDYDVVIHKNRKDKLPNEIIQLVQELDKITKRRFSSILE